MEIELKGAGFGEKVKDAIPEEKEREKLFEALRHYQSSQDLTGLVTELRKLLNEPSRLELYEHIRPLVQLSHQIEYSRKVPQPPGVKKRVIRLRRQPGESLGFALRGGYEHGLGVFVSKVQPKSQAAQKGLKVGDEVVRVNGFSTTEATHNDVLNLIKSRNEIVLKVTYIGMLPLKDTPTEALSWNYVDKIDSCLALDEVLDPKAAIQLDKELKIFIDTSGTSSMGCGILSGPPYFPGIFVEKVRPGSLAAEAGLEVGDQIIEVNDQSFIGIKHKEAVIALKGSKQLNIVIKKKAGLDLFTNKESGTPSLTRTVSESSSSPRVPPTPSPHTPSSQTSPTSRTVTTINVSYASPAAGGTTPSSDRPNPESPRYGTSDDQATMEESVLIMQHLEKFAGSMPKESAVSEPPVDAKHDSPWSLRKEPGGRAPSPAPVLPAEPELQDTAARHPVESDASPRTEMIRQQPEVLGGKGAVLAARHLASGRLGTPTLLGAGDSNLSTPTHTPASPTLATDPSQLFSEEELDGRELIVVTLEGGQPLGLEVEGGIGTPLVDKILVAEVFSGSALASGEVVRGDQILMVNSRRFVNTTAAQAENVLKEAETETEITLVLARGTFFNDEDAVTYF